MYVKKKKKMQLQPIIKAFENRKNNLEAYESLLSQFLTNFEVDITNLSVLSKDNEFPIFLQQLYDVLLDRSFPSPNEGEIPNVQITVLSFLTTLSNQNPDLLSLIATYAPLNRLVSIFFERNMADDRIIDQQPSHILYPLQFLSAISQSCQIIITSTEALHMLFAATISLIHNQQLAQWAIAVIAGFCTSSTTARSFLQALPNVTTLKREIASLLTSHDHNIMLVSLGTLCAVFTRSVNVETSMKVAFSALITPPSLPIATSISSSIMLQLADEMQLSLEDQEVLINTALKSTGMRAFILFRLINEIASGTQSKIFALLQQPEFFAKYFKFVNETECSFVAVAATHLLQTVFDESQPPTLNETIEEPFLDALKFIINYTKEENIEKIESLLLIMRILILSNDSVAFVIKMMQTNEDQIFLAFQRCVENSFAFASLNFFLFLYSSAHLFSKWLIRLRELILDSHFPALLVQCLTHSQNRRAISDALFGLTVITNGVKAKPPALNIPLADAVSNGFFLINRQAKQEKIQNELRIKELHNEYEQKIRTVEVERDLSEHELNSFKEVSEISKAQNDFSQQKIEDLQEQYEKLKTRFLAKKEKLKVACEELKKSDEEIQNLSEQLSKSEELVQTRTKKLEKLQSKMSELQETETQFSQLSECHEQTEGKYKGAMMKLKDFEKEVEDLTARVAEEKSKKNKIDKLLTEAQLRIDELSSQVAKSKTEANDALQKMERSQLMLNEKSRRELELVEETRKLREELSKAKTKISEIIIENDHYKELVSVQASRIATLKKDKKELLALSQMIHKITNGQISPECLFNADSIPQN